MKDENRQVLMYTGLAFLIVLISGLAADLLLPETGIGDAGRFAVPILTSVLAGLWIHMRFRDILDFDSHFSH